MNETQRVNDAGFSSRGERPAGSRPSKPVPPDFRKNRNRSKYAPASPKHAIPYQPRGAQLPVLVYSWRPPAKSSQPPSRCLVTYSCFIPVSALPGHRTHNSFAARTLRQLSARSAQLRKQRPPENRHDVPAPILTRARCEALSLLAAREVRARVEIRHSAHRGASISVAPA